MPFDIAIDGILCSAQELKFGHLHDLSPVRIARDVLIDALYANLNARASVGEHFVQVRLQAVVRSRLDRDADALRSGRKEENINKISRYVHSIKMKLI